MAWRLGKAGADAYAGGLDFKFIIIHPRQRFAENLRNTIKPVRPSGRAGIESCGLIVKPGHMVRACKEYSWLDRRFSCPLIEVEHTVNICSFDDLPRALDSLAAHVNDPVAAIDKFLNGSFVTEIAIYNFFIRLGFAQALSCA